MPELCPVTLADTLALLSTEMLEILSVVTRLSSESLVLSLGELKNRKVIESAALLPLFVTVADKVTVPPDLIMVGLAEKLETLISGRGPVIFIAVVEQLLSLLDSLAIDATHAQ